MKKVLFLVVLVIAVTPACKKKSIKTSDQYTESDLVGYWEAFEIQNLKTGETAVSDTGFGKFLFGIYMDAFQLRSNKEMGIYYQSSGNPDPNRVDGNWDLQNDTLVIAFNVHSKILSLENQELTLEDKTLGNNLIYKLRRSP